MGKRLIIAEKPSVGRDIANVLNCRENGDGCRIGAHDIVTWAVGHLVGLCYPDELDKKYTDWKVEDLPIIPESFQLKILESGEKQYEIVKALMNSTDVDSIVCATDAGREGELIFRYIYQLAGCQKPVYRLWISSLTYRAIKEGFENLKPAAEYDNLYESARSRSEADWLIGMNGSRAYAIENEMRSLSVGRVLSPTLAILVQRELERRSFVPESFCEVVASFEHGFDGRLINPEKEETQDWSHFSIKDKEYLERFVKSHSSAGEIIFADNDEEFQPPQQLYDLTSLQRDANRLFGMSSKRTLDIAQILYERYKAITYPRTDSRYLSADLVSTFPKRLESLLSGEIGTYARQAMSSERDLFGRFIYNKGVSDHHAIIPTGEAKGLENWSKQEKQIYALISRRFVGMFFPDRHVVHQHMMISVDHKRFLSVGERVEEAGWSVIDTSRRSGIQELPDLNKGDCVDVIRMRLRTDQTKAPAPHTEASLLTAMEHAGKIVNDDNADDIQEVEFGIGTPATRAATIEKLIEKEMVVRKGRALIPSEYGIKLVSILPEFLQSPEITGDWEAKLSQISRGEESPTEFMAGIKGLTKEVVNYAIKLGDTGIKEAKSVGPCPLCGSPVREYETAYYCVNKDCGFRKIYKAVKGFHPTLHSITMRELLANGVAETKMGAYRIIMKPPYIEFKYAPKKAPNYQNLYSLIEDYGLETVDKVSSGGGLWIAGDKHDELMKDFIRDCRDTGCEFVYSNDSKALKHRSGWCHKVAANAVQAYEEAFKKESSQIETGLKSTDKTNSEENDPVLDLIISSGFEYVDKRSSGGSLWFVASENEGRQLAEKCKELGVSFVFTAKGGRASKKRPAWYSVKQGT